MSKRRDKATKLIDAFDKAVKDKTVVSVGGTGDLDAIDEQYFITRARLNYYINSLLKRIKELETYKASTEKA